MKTIVKSLAAATLAISVILPGTLTTEASAMSAHKYCQKVATKYANKKTDKKVFTHMVAGGVMGGLLGNALGGKKTTVGFAAGGAALGMMHVQVVEEDQEFRAHVSCMYNK